MQQTLSTVAANVYPRGMRFSDEGQCCRGLIQGSAPGPGASLWWSFYAPAPRSIGRPSGCHTADGAATETRGCGPISAAALHARPIDGGAPQAPSMAGAKG